MNFAETLKFLRINKNLSQPELAKLLNVSNGTISFWENDINEPKATYIYNLAKIFNVTTDYLLGLEDDCGNNNSGVVQLSTNEQRHIQEYKMLPKELQNLVDVYTQTILQLEKEKSELSQIKGTLTKA